LPRAYYIAPLLRYATQIMLDSGRASPRLSVVAGLVVRAVFVVAIPTWTPAWLPVG